MKPPFSVAKLDALMDQTGVEVLLATSKENVQYLLGGYECFLFAHKNTIGVSRYVPCLGYVKGQPEKAFYVGSPLENNQQAVEPGFWVKNVRNNSWQSEKTGRETAEFLRKLGFANRTVGVESSFLPADCFSTLQAELPGAKFIEAHPVLDELRAVKRPDELALLQEASDLIVNSMLTVMHGTKPGTTTREIVRHLVREETNRGLDFQYCATATGPSYNRTPSDAQWEKGNILSLDSGGNKSGYLGDLCRMTVLGQPTQLMTDLLAEVQAVQAAARAAIKAGATGNEIFETALAEQAKCAHKDEMDFFAHGMGMIQHEAPHLRGTGGIPYPGLYENRPIEAGMVLSVETDLRNPEVGFIKLEDTVAVTQEGLVAYGDRGRDWTVVEA